MRRTDDIAYRYFPDIDWEEERLLKTYCEKSCEDFDPFEGGCRLELLPSECPKLISKTQEGG